MIKHVFLAFILAFYLFMPQAGQAQNDIEAHPSCAKCGMYRKAFGYSRMLVKYEDGGQTGLCSVHCAGLELASNPGRKIEALLVADRTTRELIEAEQAVWIMGGKKTGVMTSLPKWAFMKKEAAEKFVEEYGGEIVGWPEVWETVSEEIGRLR